MILFNYIGSNFPLWLGWENHCVQYPNLLHISYVCVNYLDEITCVLIFTVEKFFGILDRSSIFFFFLICLSFLNLVSL